jgi:tRNA1Val (adenine37-N6)-methyltransferase
VTAPEQSGPPALDDEALSCDPILRGRLHLWQPRHGYRFSVDPLLLVHFAAPLLSRLDGAEATDLGTGSAIAALLLARRSPTLKVRGLELQPRLAALARRNVLDNGLADRVSIVEVDVADRDACRRVVTGASVDLVVSNPPYRSLGEGALSPNPEEAIARHELRLTLDQLLGEARRQLRPDGRCLVVYPADRLVALLAAVVASGMQPVRLRLVHDRPDAPASLVLIDAKKSRRGRLAIEPPLILRAADGAPTEEAERAVSW